MMTVILANPLAMRVLLFSFFVLSICAIFLLGTLFIMWLDSITTSKEELMVLDKLMVIRNHQCFSKKTKRGKRLRRLYQNVWREYLDLHEKRRVEYWPKCVHFLLRQGGEP